ncbi:MAG: hypothetical protein FWH27_09475 [Planctomycetaceae bacterium]|nr:hypothetical protein [Planctomycetaceae bacterium]
METVFMFCSVLGGTILVIQTLLSVIGFGDTETDVDVDTGDFDTGDSAVGHSHSSGFHIFKVISFRTMVAGITFFGLAGWGTLIGTENPLYAALVAVLAGLAAVFLVYFLYRWMDSMRYQGNVSGEKLVGATGSVYVRIPAQGKGVGKVLVTQQHRTMEYEAISVGKELSTGTQITVLKVVSPTVVEVSEVR